MSGHSLTKKAICVEAGLHKEPRCIVCGEGADDNIRYRPVATVEDIATLLRTGRLVIFDWDRKTLLSNDDVANVCENGDAIQITLRSHES